MSHPISRRSVAKGAAWAVPTAAVATVTPAFAASRPLTSIPCGDEGCAAPYWPAKGAMSYTVQGGGSGGADTTIQVNWAANGPGTVGGSVSLLFNDGAGQSNIPPAWIVLADGTYRRGVATLGGTASWVVPSGVSSSTSFEFNDTAGTSTNGLLNNATINAPATFAWTDSAGKLRRCLVLVSFKLRPTGAYSAGVQRLAAEPTFSSLPGCTSACSIHIESATGYVAAGGTVTVKGSGFTGITSGTYNGVAVTNIKVISDTQLTYTQPAAPGVWGSLYPLELSNGTCKANRQLMHG